MDLVRLRVLYIHVIVGVKEKDALRHNESIYECTKKNTTHSNFPAISIIRLINPDSSKIAYTSSCPTTTYYVAFYLKKNVIYTYLLAQKKIV